MDESDTERFLSLQDSLRHFKLSAKEASDEKIAQVYETYKECSFHVGIIELGLERAERIDPQHQALIAFETDANYRDENSSILLERRLATYQNILDGINDVFEMRNQRHVPPGRFPISNIEEYYEAVKTAAISSTDKLFHYRFYAWLMKKKAMFELLTVETDYLIPYLEKCMDDKQQSLEFLWRYHRLKEHYVESARCLDELAYLPLEQLELNLQGRVEYLAQAVINGRCGVQKDKNASPYVQDLEKRLNFAQDQVRIGTESKEFLEFHSLTPS